jgi:hypothetical protein
MNSTCRTHAWALSPGRALSLAALLLLGTLNRLPGAELEDKPFDVTSPAAPPGGGGGSRALMQTVLIDSTPLRSVSVGREVTIMDRFFALLNQEGINVISGPLKHSRQVEANRGLLDFFD